MIPSVLFRLIQVGFVCLQDQISELEERNGGLSRKVRELERYIELKTTGKGESWKKGFFEVSKPIANKKIYKQG